MRAITKRAICLAAGVGSFTAAVTLGGIGAAQATAPMSGGDCGDVKIVHSLDGGQTWSTDGRMDGGGPPATISVKLSDTPAAGCMYNVSLASYSAQGPDWASSGHQDFLGWDTVTLSEGKTSATLDVSKYAPTCFGQIDLYGNGTEYDGGSGEGHGALPHYPDSSTPTDLITAWNGGSECKTPTPTPTPTTDTPTPTDTTATPTPTDSTGTPTPTATTATPSPTVSSTVGDTSSPTPTASGPTSTTPPSGTPSVPPATSSSSGSGNLAETGGNGSQTVAFAGGGAALLVLGGAAVYFTRRRRSGAHS